MCGSGNDREGGYYIDMNVWAFVFCLAAFVVFVVAALVPVGRLVPAGLALFVLGFIATFAASGVTVHF